MIKLIDKLIILLFCIALFLMNSSYDYIVIPLLVTLSVSAFNSYFERKSFYIAGFILNIILCFLNPVFIYFLPVTAYDLVLSDSQLILLISLIPIVINFDKSPLIVHILIFVMFALVYLLKYRSNNMEKMKNKYTELRDSSKELSINLENKNKDLMEKQDYEINLATLHERNRIAREIHDNVGHLLSSSILQIGALLAITKDEKIKENLNTIKNTLSQGMDSIRNSIHDLHEQSIDLYTEIETLVKGFAFCEISFEYDIESNVDKKIKYAFIAIVKEALSNIIKHSNATKAAISVLEHPALYQLVIKDNGTGQKYNSGDGIGLKNIKDRINSLNGIININNDKGFVIFISVPKEK